MGKTTVAFAVADRAAGRFQGGARFVNLSRVDDPARVPGAVANAIRPGMGVGSGGIAMAQPLCERELLLRLDNCGHLIASVANCADGNALAYPAIELFVDCATDRLDTFVLTDTDAQTVVALDPANGLAPSVAIRTRT